ncbi:MAG: choline ABC transporter ATP-binding protein, partial [Vibrio sp.]
ILLMDEPFSALDPLIRAQLQDELLMLQKKLNKTILFVSHDLDEALKIGNHIAIMESGRLIQHSTPQEIVLAPKTDYVKDFVAHTNPLNVLKGRSLMLPTQELTQNKQGIELCAQQQIWMEHTQNAIEKSVTVKAQSTPSQLTLRTIEPGQLDNLSQSTFDASQILATHPDISMREAIELKNKTPYPILMIEDNQVVGILSDKSFYDALLGNYQPQTEFNSAA